MTGRAWNLIRPQPWYRRETFDAGLRAAGYALQAGAPSSGRPGDVLLIWNRYGGNHAQAEQFERGGGTVLVAENGYIGKGGVAPKYDVHPKGPRADSYYALAIGYHNGCGRWPERAGDRWMLETETYGARYRALELAYHEWRTSGEHILVCPNRSFGVGKQVMPPDWGPRTVERLKAITKRPVRLRPHPGNDAPKRPLGEDLKGAWAVVIWSSSSGVHALLEGIQVICEAPGWIMKGACPASLEQIEESLVGERMPHFERMAWAQWTCAEIETGEPFRHLLSPTRQTQVPPHP